MYFRGIIMKESKILTIVYSLLLLIMIIFLVVGKDFADRYYDIIISIITGLIVGVITTVSQYFISKTRMKSEIFNLYYDYYRFIINLNSSKICNFHSFVIPIYFKTKDVYDKLSVILSDYSGFISQKRNKFYLMVDPKIQIDNRIINRKIVLKLLLPINKKKYDKIFVPLCKKLRETLLKINKKKFNELEKFNEEFIKKIWNN